MPAPRPNRLPARRLLLALAPACLLAAGPAAGIDINWDGNTNDPSAPFGDNLHWSDPGNWDLDAVPNGAIFDVFIGQNPGFPTGVSVEHDRASTSISSLLLGDGSTLRLEPGTNLQVTDTATINGFIDGQGGNLTATTNTGTTTTLGNRARFVATAGSVIQLDATSYSSVGLNDSFTLMSADGAGSLLDLSSMSSIDTGFNGLGGTKTHTIQAINDGAIDLSSVTQINGPTDIERLDIHANSGGTIDLSGLQAVTATGDGHVRFIVDGTSSVTLPSLQTVSYANFFVTSGGTLSDAGSGAWSYSSVGLNNSFTLMSADGAGSLLDLSSMSSIDTGFNGLGGTKTHTIQAINGGAIDLSSVSQINGPTDIERLDIHANSGGTIDLSSLHTVAGSSSAAIRMQVDGGSTLRLGRVYNSQRVDITSGAGGDLIDIKNEARLRTGTTLVVADDAAVEVGGRFSHRHTNEASVNLGQPGNTTDAGDNPRGATVVFDGSGGEQLVEVGGLDFSTLTDLLNNGNFGFGQMVVGTPGQATEVVLLDIADNGNRAGGFEALYLYGNSNGDGLVINNGSTLVLNDLNVYTNIGGTLTSVIGLFGPGQTTIPFDNGFIELRREPTTAGDVNVDGVIDTKDIDLTYEATAGNSPHQRFNLNGDGSTDMADLDELVQVILATSYGDLDLDGDVDDADFGLAFAGFSGPGILGGGYGSGDIDFDGDTDDADYGLAFAAFTGPGAPANVPEPASLALLGLLAVSLSHRGGPLLGRQRR